MRKKECIALILAGGQGTRLGYLTKNNAKPAVPFGGRYRIIDFALSNCSNSDIDTVGVLTQYEPLVLNSYIGLGSPWNLDRNNGGVSILPPYMNVSGGEWYKGTANAVYQNSSFINRYNPEYVLVLSGDHIYKMDYSYMLEYHKLKGADATIAVIKVPFEEAGRFGIMNTDENGRIIEFEEKPKVPKSTLASMGVYIFNWNVLNRFLMEDKMDHKSSHDFGKNVIPRMIASGMNVFAYAFEGYWKDVGTIESYYEASMELLEKEPAFDLYDTKWKIYSKNSTVPPSYIAPDSRTHNSMINEGCTILGDVENSILFSGVYVGPGACVRDSIILQNVAVGEGSIVYKAIIGEDTKITNNTTVSSENSGRLCCSFDRSDSGILLIPENTVV